MYGLSADADVSFLVDAPLIQVCIGENETILNLHPSIAIMIASTARIGFPDGADSTFSEPKEFGPAMLPLLGSRVGAASALPPGTLRLTWESGHVLDIFDSWKEYESYTVSNGDTVIVV